MTPMPASNQPSWKYCECGCKGSELTIGGQDFWLYNSLKKDPKGSLFLYLGHGHSGVRLGQFHTREEADKVVAARMVPEVAKLEADIKWIRKRSPV